jgi:hypothetical protein
LYLHHPTGSTVIRQSALTGVMNARGNHVFSEIAFPPFGLIMSIGHPPIDARLCNITHFAQYAYKTWDVVYMKLPVFPVTTLLPGDFRSVAEVQRDLDEDKHLGRVHLNPPIPAL